MTVQTFTQAQSEAAVRLLLAGRRQDGVVALAEGHAFDREIQALPWNAEHELHYFVVTEAARIRNTLATQRREFLAEQCACFRTSTEKETVLNMLIRVVSADGIAPKESTFVAEVQQLFKA
jgi:hypothetical protein